MNDMSFLLTAVAALAVAGAIGGVVSGLLGVGGGIITVPVMFEVFGLLGIDESVRMHLVVGTSLATIIPTAITSARAHAKRGAVDKDLMRRLGPPLFAGVILGSFIAGPLKGQILTGVFGVAALVVAIYMAFRRDTWRLGEDLPRGAGTGVLGGSIGLLSVLMGIGGGTLGVPAMTLFNVPIHRAVGTASALGLVVSLPGAIGFVISGWGHPDLPPFSLGYVNVLASATLLSTMLLTVPIGAKLAHSISQKALRLSFATFLTIVATRMLLSLV
jgi:uncharacterized membrane protein YfcA